MRANRLSYKSLFHPLLLGVLMVVGSAHGQNVTVSGQSLRDIAVYPTREAHASVESLNKSTISAEISGKIVVINAEIGQTVSRGDMLIQLDSTDHRLTLLQAKANLDAAESKLKLSRKQLNRSRQLVEKGFISPEALNIREAEHANAEASLRLYAAQYDAAKRAVEKCTIASPFDGIVSARLGHLGEIAQPGSPLLQLHDIESIELAAKIQPSDVASLKSSQLVQFLSNGIEYDARIKRITPIISTNDRYQDVRLTFTRAIPAIGAPGIIKWSSKNPHLPVNTIVRRGNLLGVFLFEKGIARFTPLETADEGNPAKTDLSLDSIIITSGQHQLQDNQPVNLAQ
jgi:RND family efflux transporter MFP subunit